MGRVSHLSAQGIDVERCAAPNEGRQCSKDYRPERGAASRRKDLRAKDGVGDSEPFPVHAAEQCRLYIDCVDKERLSV